ncbi:microcin C ABC transporter permease YejB [Marinobacter xestospongiae]|uniref:microcin C ABC transporter permease YejB n=1 Tax=Marinobacter xestospongiae TaxID=994319 RepID=UPI002006D1AF|nr:microcin C ABC transporter permease YejB [Marinobacter xestospongiae]MCK7566187.1 microcin C ABC transporter permease YejB [Marinobacter xestospongiae]
MGAYILRRLALMIPTLVGIMLLNFIVVQAAPGGPIEQFIANMEGHGGGTLDRATGGGGAEVADSSSDSRGARGIPEELLKELEVLYGFDKPPHERFLKMLTDYATFDFGESFYRDRTVVELVLEKLPVSISLGLWSTLIIYLISIPLGVRKAVTDGSRFDVWTSSVIVVGYAIPGFLFAFLLIVLFAGGTYFDIFPLRGLTSPNWDQMPWYQQVADYFWHLALPVTANVIGGFATLTLLTKNSFLDEIGKQYVVTARAKGLEERQVLYGHVFRNAMLIVIASLPGVLVALFFTGSLLIEVIFSLDGLGLLGFEAALNRDYPVVFGTLYIFTLMGLVLKLVSDVTYVLVDPRIDFESREG